MIFFEDMRGTGYGVLGVGEDDKEASTEKWVDIKKVKVDVEARLSARSLS